MSTQQDINAFRAQRIANTHDPLALMANTQTPCHPDHSSLITYMQHPQPNNNFVSQPSFNMNYLQHPMQNPGDISNPTTAFNMALALMAKAFTLNDTTPTNNNQRSSSNPSSMQIAQPGMNMDQDRQMLMVEDNVGNQFRPNAMQNVGNQHGDGNVVTAPAEGNGNGINGNTIRCYNCQGEDHYASNCTVKPRKLDAAYLQKQMQIAQKEEAGIQLTSEEFDFMAAVGACKETKKAYANCTLENNLQQASSSGTQSDKAPVYDSDGSAEVHHSENCYNNDIFNMFTQEEQYTELLEPIPEPHQVQQNDSNVISVVSSVEQSGGTVEQHPANIEETRAYFESLYNNLATEVEKVNLVNHKMKETNAELTTELASSGKQITTLNEEISNLSKQLSTEKSTVSSLLEEKKKLKSDFKIREDELLDKQIQLENKIKELDNILVKTGQSIQNDHMLSPKAKTRFTTPNRKWLWVIKILFISSKLSENNRVCIMAKCYLKSMILLLCMIRKRHCSGSKSRLKMKQLNKEIKPANYTKINHLSGVFVSQTAKSQEEVYFSNTSKMATVSKSISIPNEEFSDDTTPSVARKFLNEKQPNLYRDFKALAKKLMKSLLSTMANGIMKLSDSEEHCPSQDIMSIVQNPSVVDTSNLQTKLDCTKERLENCIIKKENEYAKLWNDWYKKCEECKYDKISYDKAYNNMQQKIERLQAQLGDQKGQTTFSLDPELYAVTHLPNSMTFPKVGETNALSKPVTSNSVPSSRESTDYEQ
ncbi:retrovirus-related pol polyprotein from transposon TNT 1-94 [Tanacetum coccineum]